MNNESNTKLFVVSAPSAGGKTTIIKNLISSLNGLLTRVVTCTTRNKRSEEIDGIDYRFLSEEEFVKLIEKRAFVEHSIVYGNYYGVLKTDLAVPGSKVLSLDSKGVNNFKKMHIPAVYILIIPPSLEELKKRLLKRGSEKKDEIEIRLAEAKKEIDEAGIFDHVVVNDKIEDAIKTCKKIITGGYKNEKTY